MVAGSPFLCMRQTAQSVPATASSAPGAIKASMSLIIDAPALRASCMTSGRFVSTDIGLSTPFNASRTGMIRSNSCAAETGRAPGREDSPPTSMMSAPSSIKRRAWETADFASKNLPPSEKESGVTFTTPMTSGFCRSKKNLPALSPGDLFAEAALGCRRWCGGAFGAGAAGGRLGRRLRAARLRRTRRAARHDVADLLGVDRLPLEQRLRHHLDLVAVLLDQVARHAVLLVDDAADLAVDLLHGRFRHVLVRGHGAAEEHLALVLAVNHRPELVGHAPLGHHAARHVGRLLEVVARAGGHLVHEDFLGDAPAEHHGDLVQAPLAIVAIAVGLRQRHRHAERAAARDDRHLVDRIALRQHRADQGMAGLVIRRVAALIL